ncbi:MAG TPA: tetratricopeptide repeat protein, partial [Verrucomicrobiaceae bacterium]
MKIARSSSINVSAPMARRLLVKCLVPFLLMAAMASCSREAKKAGYLARAQEYYSAGELEKAKIEYLNVLRLDPNAAVAYQQIGFIWSEEGAAFLAMQYLRKASELSPDNLEIRTKLALNCALQGWKDEANDELDLVLAKNPANDEAVVLLAELTNSIEEANRAEKKLAKIKSPDRAAIHVALARLARTRNDPATYEKESLAAVALDPKFVPAQLALAGLWLLKKDLAKAEEAIRTAAGLAPLRSPAQLKYAEFKRDHRSVKEARAFLDDLSKKVPDYLSAWRLDAQLALTEKKYSEALNLLENVFSRDPNDVEARLLQAQALIESGDAKKAIAHLENLDKHRQSLRKDHSRDPQIMYALALAHLKDSNPAQARALLEEAVKNNPDYPEVSLLLAKIEMASGDARGAAALMEQLLTKSPANVPAQLLLADAYRAMGRYDDAAGVYRKQIQVTPGIAAPYFLLGMTLR